MGGVESHEGLTVNDHASTYGIINMITSHKFTYFIALLMLFACSSMPVSASEHAENLSSMLSHMEDDAEQIVHTALAKNAAGSRELFNNIRRRMDQLHHSQAGQPFDERSSRELLMAYSWMRIISIDIKQKAWVGTAIAANQLTASIIRFTSYPSLRQRDTAWMGYLGRELLLLDMEDAKANAQLLDVRRANLVDTWSRIRIDLIKKDFRNKPLVLRGDKLIHLLRDNHDRQTTIVTARKLLKFIDEIEHA